MTEGLVTLQKTTLQTPCGASSPYTGEPESVGPDWAGSRCFFKAHVLEKTDDYFFRLRRKLYEAFVYSLALDFLVLFL